MSRSTNRVTTHTFSYRGRIEPAPSGRGGAGPGQFEVTTEPKHTQLAPPAAAEPARAQEAAAPAESPPPLEPAAAQAEVAAAPAAAAGGGWPTGLTPAQAGAPRVFRPNPAATVPPLFTPADERGRSPQIQVFRPAPQSAVPLSPASQSAVGGGIQIKAQGPRTFTFVRPTPEQIGRIRPTPVHTYGS